MKNGASLFDGPEYQPERDNPRLESQIHRVYQCMRRIGWATIEEVALITGDPPASVSAQMRHLRKPRWGSHTVERRQRPGAEGLYEYLLIPSEEGLLEGRRDDDGTVTCPLCRRGRVDGEVAARVDRILRESVL